MLLLQSVLLYGCKGGVSVLTNFLDLAIGVGEEAPAGSSMGTKEGGSVLTMVVELAIGDCAESIGANKMKKGRCQG